MSPVRSCIVALALGAASAAQAQNFLATPGNGRVYPINENVFEVVGNSGLGYDLWWCGASQYARRVLGAGWGAQVSIARGLGPSQATGRRSSVQFTLNPAALDVTVVHSTSPNALVVGDTKTVQTGNMSCDRLRFPQRLRQEIRMRYLFGLGGAAFALSLASPLAAQKMYGPGGSTIYPIDGSSFEVVATSRDKAMWCGAAKYARRALKVGWNTQLVVTRGPEPSVLEDGRRPGVQFTTNPAAAGVAPVAENGGLAPGSWQTVSIANRNCARLDNSSNR